MSDRSVVIVGAKRTPIGSFQGQFAACSAVDLGAAAIAGAVAHAGIDPADASEVIMGCVLPAGQGQAPARQASIQAGVPVSVGCMTINKVCGSGLKAVMLAAAAIRAGDAHVVAAGGMESMTNAPYLARGARAGFRYGNTELRDAIIADGLWCSIEDCHMGTHAERVAIAEAVAGRHHRRSPSRHSTSPRCVR